MRGSHRITQMTTEVNDRRLPHAPTSGGPWAIAPRTPVAPALRGFAGPRAAPCALARLAACEGCRTSTPAVQAPAADRAAPPTVRLYLVTDLAGALEPCGCTKDQLGGLDHFGAWVKREPARVPTTRRLRGPALLHGRRSSTRSAPTRTAPRPRPSRASCAARLRGVRPRRERLGRRRGRPHEARRRRRRPRRSSRPDGAALRDARRPRRRRRRAQGRLRRLRARRARARRATSRRGRRAKGRRRGAAPKGPTSSSRWRPSGAARPSASPTPSPSSPRRRRVGEVERRREHDAPPGRAGRRRAHRRRPPTTCRASPCSTSTCATAGAPGALVRVRRRDRARARAAARGARAPHRRPPREDLRLGARPAVSAADVAARRGDLAKLEAAARRPRREAGARRGQLLPLLGQGDPRLARQGSGDRGATASRITRPSTITTASPFADRVPPPAAPGQASYVGIDACSKCHAGPRKVWNGDAPRARVRDALDAVQGVQPRLRGVPRHRLRAARREHGHPRRQAPERAVRGLPRARVAARLANPGDTALIIAKPSPSALPRAATTRRTSKGSTRWRR